MMDTLQKPLVVRVTGIQAANPEEAEQIVQTAIARRYEKYQTQLPKFRVTIVPSSDNHETYDALLDFDAEQPFPVFLRKIQKDALASILIARDETEEDYLTFDCHFHGFTQLYPTAPDGPITADIIAITGLNGHAYGSWRARDEPWRMWLRHFLSRDLPNCRTMIYGYNSKLSSYSVDTLLDYGRGFLEGLTSVRNSEQLQQRPLIFVAHSYGGIILAHCLIKAVQHMRKNGDPAIATLYKATHSILFFGTPHKGLVVDDIQRMIEGTERHPRQDLLDEITAKSNLLRYQLADFKDLIEDRKIVNFYETQQTRRLELNAETHRWARTGPYMTAVEPESALLALPGSMEIKIDVDADHSNMVKFDSHTSKTYKSAIKYLKEFQGRAGEVVAQRFQTRATKKAPSSTVPFSRDPMFVERQDTNGRNILEILESRLGQFATHTRLALVGLGGVGKSQIAIECSHRLRAKAPQTWIFWIFAASAGRIEQSFRHIAAAVELPDRDHPKVDIFALVSEWLNDPNNGCWLMILDNADDMTVFQKNPPSKDSDGHQNAHEYTQNSEQACTLLDCIPQAGHGALLITSRDRRAAYQMCGSNDGLIHMGPMSEAEAVQLLRRRLSGTQIDAELEALANELDHIPLALSQAAAYISLGAPRLTVARYLALYKHNQAGQSRLLDNDNKELRRDPSVPNSVIRTWQISFDQIRNTNAPAADLLSLMAVLDRQGIPEMLFLQNTESPIEFEEALAPLIAFSLISTDEKGKTFEMHRLVQLATRRWLQLADQQDKWQGKAIVMLSKAMPNGDYENWATCRLLLPHAHEVLFSTSLLELEPQAQATLLHNMSWYNLKQGNYSAAEGQCLKSLLLWSKILGAVHPSTLKCANNLAVIYREQGRLKEAEELGVRVLETEKRVLGEEHSYTLISMAKLAFIYWEQGRWKEAEELEVRVVETKKRVLGEEHPDTLISMKSLAVTRYALEQFAEAMQLLKDCASMSVKIFGPEHPHTKGSLQILEAWEWEQQPVGAKIQGFLQKLMQMVLQR